MFLSQAMRGAASATVRAVKRRTLLPTKAALTLVTICHYFFNNENFMSNDLHRNRRWFVKFKALIAISNF